MSATRRGAEAGRNGHEPGRRIKDPRRSASLSSVPGLGLAGRVGGRLTKLVTDRIPVADLDERDPDYIRERLPQAWLLASLYFRGEVRGLGNIPEDGPVLLVGNHSGGNLT